MPSPDIEQVLACCRRADWVESERLCRRLLEAKPDDAQALYLASVVAVQRGRISEAIEFLSKGAGVDPDSAEAHANLGNVFHNLGRRAEALASYDRALGIDPNHLHALYARGNILSDVGRAREALESYDRALAISPDFADAHVNRASTLCRLGLQAEALDSYERAIALRPNDPDTLYKLGSALTELKRFAEALRVHNRALAMRPDHVQTLSVRGHLLRELKRPREALESYDRALSLRPDLPQAHYNRAVALSDLKRYREAVECYERALAIKPDYAEARFNGALCNLIVGDFLAGWPGYEWRWESEQQARSRRVFPQPMWRGTESLRGKTLFVHSEQGLGDTLLFCRYVSEVAALGADVVLELQPALLPLLADLSGAARVLGRGEPLPPFDYHCPLLSLPLAFKTTLPTVPARVPYVRSDPVRARAWQQKLGSGTKPRIGIAWSGAMANTHDETRSLRLEQVLPLALDPVQLVSLQKELRKHDAELLASRPDLLHFGDELRDFADTAALVDAMDLVLAVDTSVAHLAGAMGKPVWIMLAHNADWRWLLDREDSVWYPTARLFRQHAIGDWASVIDKVRAELAKKFWSKG